jgi:hypothetical protein
MMATAGAPAPEPAPDFFDRGYEIGGEHDPDVIAAKERANERAQKRAEKVHDLIFRFLEFYVDSAGDKVKILDTWRIFLEDLDRKVHILHWISVNDIWCENETKLLTLPRRLVTKGGLGFEAYPLPSSRLGDDFFRFASYGATSKY